MGMLSVSKTPSGSSLLAKPLTIVCFQCATALRTLHCCDPGTTLVLITDRILPVRLFPYSSYWGVYIQLFILLEYSPYNLDHSLSVVIDVLTSFFDFFRFFVQV